MKTIKKIICPVDVFDFLPEAVEYAVTLAKAFGADILVLHVMEPLPPRYNYTEGGYAVPPGDHDKYEKEVKQKIEAKLTELVAQSFGDCQVAGEVVLGHPAVKIIEIAEEQGGDIIVMASHGRSFFGRAIYGSVTNKVLANTKIPVLVIHPKEQ